MKSAPIYTCGAIFAHVALANKPVVSSEALQAMISSEDLLRGSQQLQDFAYAYPDRNRVFGGKAHNDTVNWLYTSLTETGYYNVSLQPFVELFSGGNASLILDGVTEPVGLFTYTPSGTVTAPVVAVSNLGCAASDFPAEVAENVALISRGTCPFAQKASNAKAAGAVAAIIYDNVASEAPATGTLGGAGDYVPVVGITQASGQSLLALLTTSTVLAEVQVNSILENRTTYNVIAETKTGDHDNILTLGGHTDSVEAGPGINDDGSGIIGILEVAKALAHFEVPNAVRFLFWSAEEFGLLGSEHYISTLNESDAELGKIRAYLNFDMIASPNYVYAIYDGDGSAFNISGPPGSAEIEKHFEDFYESKGQSSVPTAFDGRSDYGPFLDVGIAAGGIFTGAEKLKTEAEAKLFGGEVGVAYDANYHQAGDNITNLNVDAFVLNTQAIAHSVATYALSFDSLPRQRRVKRDAESRRMRKERRLALADSRIGHGHAMCNHTPEPEL